MAASTQALERQAKGAGTGCLVEPLLLQPVYGPSLQIAFDPKPSNRHRTGMQRLHRRIHRSLEDLRCIQRIDMQLLGINPAALASEQPFQINLGQKLVPVAVVKLDLTRFHGRYELLH